MNKKLVLLVCVAVLSVSSIWADKTESAVVKKLNNFTDTLIENFSYGTRTPTVAVAEFANSSRKAEESKIGTAVADIINQRLSNSGKFLVVESSQIDRVIESLNLSLTGLYDEKTAASIGRLIGAEYIVLGSVTELAGFYRINVRVVKIETGATFVNESLELDSQLIEKESRKYLPPKYRLKIGASGVYDKLMEYGTECIGMTLGFSYEFRPRHSILFQATHYWYSGWIHKYYGTADGYNTNTTYTSESELTFGYGYTLPLTRYLKTQLSLSCGMLRIPWDARTQIQNPGIVNVNKTGTYIDFILNPSIDFFLYPDNPISLFISIGYRYALYTEEISFPSAQTGTEFVLPELPFNDFNMKAGFQFFF